MKLRFKGNSLRLRIARSELATLQSGGRIQESVAFPGGADACLKYVLSVGQQSEAVQVTFFQGEILVSLSPAQLQIWSDEEQVGVYASLPVAGDVHLDVALEKDFACLDRSDEDNKDTFAHPLAGQTC